MKRILLSEVATWIIASPIIYFIYLQIFNSGKQEISSSMAEALLIYLLTSIIVGLPFPLTCTLVLDRFLSIRKKTVLFIDAPIVYIILFLVIAEIVFILLGEIFRVYSYLPNFARYFIYTFEALLAYLIIFLVARDKV